MRRPSGYSELIRGELGGPRHQLAASDINPTAQASCSQNIFGDINNRSGDVPVEKRPAPRECRGAGAVGRLPVNYLLNEFAIIPCTSADALTTRAMLAGW